MLFRPSCDRWLVLYFVLFRKSCGHVLDKGPRCGVPGSSYNSPGSFLAASPPGIGNTASRLYTLVCGPVSAFRIPLVAGRDRLLNPKPEIESEDLVRASMGEAGRLVAIGRRGIDRSDLEDICRL